MQQESEWEGEMWGKNSNFLGVEEFGNGQMQPRDIHAPGTYYEYNDARINRLALSLARVFGTGLPEVLKQNIMDKIGASNEWMWQGYGSKSTVEITSETHCDRGPWWSGVYSMLPGHANGSSGSPFTVRSVDASFRFDAVLRSIS